MILKRKKIKVETRHVRFVICKHMCATQQNVFIRSFEHQKRKLKKKKKLHESRRKKTSLNQYCPSYKYRFLKEEASEEVNSQIPDMFPQIVVAIVRNPYSRACEAKDSHVVLFCFFFLHKNSLCQQTPPHINSLFLNMEPELRSKDTG